MKVKRVVERNLELRETIVKNENPFKSRLDNPSDVNVSNSTFEDKRLKEGGMSRDQMQIWYNRGTGYAKTKSR